jgi:MoaA/NifB/PqqE/SkfB family radical SAM enzyme
MCQIWKTGNAKEEMSIDEFYLLAKFLKDCGTISISLGGGEPFLREDLAEIVKIFIKKGFIVRILTNGVTSTADYIEKLAKVGLKHVSVSLDSLNPQKQEYICKKSGIWEKIIENIKLFSDILPRRGSLLLINTVVSRLNLEELPQLVQFATRIGFFISFIPVEINIYNKEFKISSEDAGKVDRIYTLLILMKKQGMNILNSTRFLQESRKFLKTGDISWRCDAGGLYFSVNPRGEISICHQYSPEGSGLSSNLINYLSSSRFLRKRLKMMELCHGCMRPCWAEVTYMIRDIRSFLELMNVYVRTYQRRGNLVNPFDIISELYAKSKCYENFTYKPLI